MGHVLCLVALDWEVLWGIPGLNRLEEMPRICFLMSLAIYRTSWYAEVF
jgi:hypothetical protein